MRDDSTYETPYKWEKNKPGTGVESQVQKAATCDNCAWFLNDVCRRTGAACKCSDPYCPAYRHR